VNFQKLVKTWQPSRKIMKKWVLTPSLMGMKRKMMNTKFLKLLTSVLKNAHYFDMEVVFSLLCSL